jgi:protein involved in polysaccharide export with SLBB domain
MKRTFSLIISFGLVFSVCLNAQRFQLGMSQMENMNQAKQAAENTHNTLLEQLQKDVFPVGNVIDANNYYIGPNDILEIQVIPSDAVPQLIIVTSECSIVSSFFGAITLKEFTLKQVRDTLNSIANKRKEGLNVVVSLAHPRRIIVNIRGNVISQGTYTFPASYSIATAIKFANQSQSTGSINNLEEQSATLRLQEARKDREKAFSETGVSETSIYGTRNIRLIRGNGTAMVVDLERAIATNDNKYNPCVREGDEIFVPFEEYDYPVISIIGEVLRPASVVYKKGDMMSHLIKMGYGFTENADLNNIILHDMSGGTKKIEVDSAGNLLSDDFNITP